MADEPKPFGSGNVFADLGLSNPAVRLVKAELALDIGRLISNGGLTIDEAAGAAGLEPDVLRGIVDKGRTDGISIERLDKVFEVIEAHGNRRKP